MTRRPKPAGPSPNEIRLRSELERTRQELRKLKAPAVPRAASALPPPPPPFAPAASEAPASALPTPPAPGGAPPASAPIPPAPTAEEALRRQMGELQQTKQRLSRLYFSQVEENRKRAQKLHQIFECICEINSKLDLEPLLAKVAEMIKKTLGFRIVLIRAREPETNRLKARAFVGLDDAARASLEAADVLVEDFLSWLKDEFKVSRSYFISHRHALNQSLSGVTPELDERKDWEWHADDLLFVPIWNRAGELVAYFSVDDPVDRLVPSRESIELLEMFGSHAGVAIENAQLHLQHERHTRDLEAASRRMQEMSALKSNFISTLSHELRTPLTAVRAYVDTLLSGREDEIPFAQLQRFLGTINEETQRLTRLIDSMLDLNRFDSGTMRLSRQTIDLVEVLEETVGLLQPIAETGQVDLKVQNEAADTRMDADRDQIKQLALHLGSNAVKFTPPAGGVTFKLSGDERDLTLQVEDSGIGIPEPLLEKIFERFYQVDSSLVRRFGGTGLGLAICKSIVEWHGGRVFAESMPGRGSRFTVVLPRRTGPRVVVRPSAKSRAGTEDVLRLAIEMVADVMNARVASLLTPDDDGNLVIQAAIGLDERVVREATIKPGCGVAGWVAQNRRPVCVSGDRDRPEIAGSPRRDYRTGTFLSVPLEGEQGLLGVLNVTDPMAERAFHAEDCHLLLQLAELVSSAWGRTIAMENSRSDMEGTAKALQGVLEVLERGRKTAPDRVRLARAVARALGLGESDVGLISFAASIHDLGMTKLGEQVTDRAGTLNEEERDALRRHPEQGAELLRPLEAMGAVRDVVLAHHEWWDGSGYPRGLKGGEIPIGSRVLAVVDAFESMTVGRPHRPPFAPEKAVAELQRLRGTQFDPDVVDAFAQAWDEVEKPRDEGAPDSWEPLSSTQGGD